MPSQAIEAKAPSLVRLSSPPPNSDNSKDDPTTEADEQRECVDYTLRDGTTIKVHPESLALVKVLSDIPGIDIGITDAGEPGFLMFGGDEPMSGQIAMSMAKSMNKARARHNEWKDKYLPDAHGHVCEACEYRFVLDLSCPYAYILHWNEHADEDVFRAGRKAVKGLLAREARETEKASLQHAGKLLAGIGARL